MDAQNNQERSSNEISDAEKASIERGLKDMEEGNTIPHKEMVKFYSKWLTK